MSINHGPLAPEANDFSSEPIGVRKSTAARLLDCSRWTIDRLIRSGDLTTFKVRGEPRVHYDSLMRLADSPDSGRPE
jgi:excisionase family DNA binding protein